MSPTLPRSGVGLRRLFPVLLVVLAGAVDVETADQQKPKLIINVIAGEGGVNIIQQQTAVAPVIEVKDENDQPVAGAIVVFSIRRGRATFNGAQTLSVTTDASGRATAAGLTPNGNGPLQIGVQARYQGQVVSATVTQSVVATVGAVAAGATAGGAAAGGGLSAAAIGAIAAGAVGGTVAALKVASDDSSAEPRTTAYAGPYSGTFVLTHAVPFTTTPVNCVSTHSVSGTLTMSLTVTQGTVTGTADTDLVQGPISDVGCSVAFTGSTVTYHATVTGTPANIVFNLNLPYSGTVVTGPVSGSVTVSFAGSLNAGVVNGALSLSQSATGTTDGSGGRPAGFPITVTGPAVALPVTLR